MTSYLNWGRPIEAVPADLATPQLLELLAACDAHPHFDIVELRLLDDGGPYVGIVVDVGDGTVAGKNSAGIWPRERLCLSFRPGRPTPAEVRALRMGFPDALHLNGVPEGQPASLCLYESWSFTERQWTAQFHLRQILSWLERTAEGTLHAHDQALEQLFYGNGAQLVLPADFETILKSGSGPFYLKPVGKDEKAPVLIASQTKPNEHFLPYQALIVQLPGVENRPIQRPPSTLGGLSDQLVKLGSSLQPQLAQAVSEHVRAQGDRASDAKERLLLLTCVPRLRDGEEERLDIRGFLVVANDQELGTKLGVLAQARPGEKAFPFVSLALPADSDGADNSWRGIELLPVDVLFLPSRGQARQLSGIDPDSAEFRGVLAGVGSLGSLLADTWEREAWGRWDYLDPDTIAPHNVVRHEARIGQVGWAKVDFSRVNARLTFGIPDEQGQAIQAKANDFDNANVDAVLTGADLLVDASTTLEVPRDWSERELPRSSSVFFTPSGMGSVLLLEDQARSIRLSSLEAQYYRAVLNEEWGAGHLQTGLGIRVGGGCRDHSAVLSNELVRLHASQLARRLRKAVASEAAVISVWSLDDDTGALEAHHISVLPSKSCQCGPWSVRWDEGLEVKLRAIRQVHLPAETGGVLVGVIDQKLQTITLVDACPPPGDSQSDETSFTRGKTGVLDELKRCEELTRGMVRYVGDWHSHPAGYPATPSGLDIVLLATLADRLAEDGVPAVMVIISDEEIGISLGEARLASGQCANGSNQNNTEGKCGQAN